MADGQTKSASRALVVYLLVVAFVCVCSIIAISQRLTIAQKGRMIRETETTAWKLDFEQRYLILKVAEKASYKNLVAKAHELKLDVIPPEEKPAESEDG